MYAFDGERTGVVDSQEEPVAIAAGKRTRTQALPPRPPGAAPVAASASGPAVPWPIARKASDEIDPFELCALGTQVQRHGHGDDRHAGQPAPEQVLQVAQGGGASLPEAVRALLEPRMGHDFSDVRIHTGGEAAAAAALLHARAYTLGSSIVFGEGQYQPTTRDGLHLLAHELTHVVQQRGGSRRAVQRDRHSDTNSAAGPAPAPQAQLTEALAQFRELAAVFDELEDTGHDTERAQLAAGLARLRGIAEGSDAGAKARVLEALSRHLPAGLVAGIPGRAAAPSQEPSQDTPDISEQRPESVALSGFLVSRSSDPAEQEAERVADAVMGGAQVQIGAAAGDVVYRGGGDGDDGDEWIAFFVKAVLALFFVVLLWLAIRAHRQRTAQPKSLGGALALVAPSHGEEEDDPSGVQAPTAKSNHPKRRGGAQNQRKPHQRPAAKSTRSSQPDSTAKPSAKPSTPPTQDASAKPSAKPSTPSTQDASAKPSAPSTQDATAKPSAKPSAPSTQDASAKPSAKPSTPSTQDASAKPTAKPSTPSTQDASAKPSTPSTQDASAKPSAKPSTPSTQDASAKPSTPSTQDASAKPATPPAPEPLPPLPKIKFMATSTFAGDPVELACVLAKRLQPAKPAEPAPSQASEPISEPTTATPSNPAKGPDAELVLELLALFRTYSAERTGIVLAICKDDLPRTKQVLEAAAPFPGPAVVQFLEVTAASGEAAAFLRGIRRDASDASVEQWWQAFQKWQRDERASLSAAIDSDEPLDQSVLAQHGREKVRWAVEFLRSSPKEQVDKDQISDWIGLTDLRGGEPARRFVTAHRTARLRSLWLFLEETPEKVAAKRSAAEWSSAFATAHKFDLFAASKGQAEDDPSGSLNNGSDCFLIAACELLALPAYAHVPLLPAVQTVVTKLRMQQPVTAHDIEVLRTYLYQLGLVEAASDLHEDASELVAKLLGAAPGVRLTEHHHVDQVEAEPELAQELRPSLASRAQYDQHGDRHFATATEAMLQVPIDAHDGLIEWINGAHQAGAQAINEPDGENPDSYEWASVGGQLQSVLQRTTRTDLRELPATLTVMLKRFTLDERNRPKKVRKAFTMPTVLEVTEQNPDAGTTLRKRYELRGVIYHHGQQQAGHYWAHVRGADDQWRTANDGRVTQDTQALVPDEGDLEHDLSHGYVYTYVLAGPGAPAPAWAAATGVDLDPATLPQRQQAAQQARQGKGKGKDKDNVPAKDEETAKPQGLGARDSTVRPQFWYGRDSLKQNRVAPTSNDAASTPQTGQINEGPCAAVVTAILAAMKEKAVAGSFMVGAVLSHNGSWYVTMSGVIRRGFPAAVTLAAKTTGLPLELVTRSEIAPVHGNLRDKKATKHILGQDIETFGPAADDEEFPNYPKGTSDSSETAGGKPGTCALPKLLAHLIELDDPPLHASEKWYTTEGKPVNVRTSDQRLAPTRLTHGQTIPSCRTCRGIVPQQLRGIDAAVLRYTQNQERRQLEIAAAAKLHAVAMHRYTKLALAQLPAFSVDDEMINPEYLSLDAYQDTREWFQGLVTSLIADRLQRLRAAKDPRYTEADLDETPDLELGEALGQRLGSAKPSAPAPKSTSRQPARGKAGRSAAPAKKPRELSGADEAMLEVLTLLAPVCQRWAAIPAVAWTGLQPESLTVGEEVDYQEQGRLIVDGWDALLEAMRELSKQLSDDEEEDDEEED